MQDGTNTRAVLRWCWVAYTLLSARILLTSRRSKCKLQTTGEAAPFEMPLLEKVDIIHCRTWQCMLCLRSIVSTNQHHTPQVLVAEGWEDGLIDRW